MGTKRERGKRYPVEFVASELGVDRKRLIRRLEDMGIDMSAGVTFREAFDALTARQEAEADRARRQKAEADTAQMDAETKRGTLMLTSRHREWVKELGTQTRVKVMEANIPEPAKKRLLASIAEIKVTQ